MLVRVPAVAALFVAAAAVFACAPEAPRPVEVALASPTLATASGLTRAELGQISESDLPEVFQVRVTGSDIAIAGRYAIVNGRIEFTPAFPFDAGQSYTISFQPAAIAGREGETAIARTASIGTAARPSAPTIVLGIDPTAGVWPANLLRMYIHFSAPMSRESGLGKITLRGADGTEVTDAFLPLEADFWSPDHRRYTVFFDPGRVKRGILPNRQRGRALVDGRRYAIEIAREWRDAEGRPLAESFRHEFTAGAPVERPMRVEDWKLSRVRGGSRDPLTVTFPWPIDRGLADRALMVQTAGGQPVAGRGVIAPGDLSWSFTPDNAWAPGDYQLSALPILEDPSGNQIGRAFEVDMNKAAPPADAKRTITFKVLTP